MSDPSNQDAGVPAAQREGLNSLARWALTFALVLSGLAVNGLLLKPVLPTSVRDNDFLGFYAGGILAGTGHLYDSSTILKVEARYSEKPRMLAFIRLPFYASLLSPLRLLDYRQAFWVWQLLSLMAVAAFVGLWPGSRAAAAVVCAWSLPLCSCFIMSQDTAFLLPVIAVVVRCVLKSKHPGLGMALAFLSVKYHLFLTLPVLIVRRRLWRAAFAAGAIGLIFLAWSFLQEGWRWPADYITALRLPTTTPQSTVLPNLHGLFYNWSGTNAWQAVAAFFVLAAVWIVGAGRWNRSLAVTLIGGLLLSYHAFLADCSLLIPASLLLLEDERLLYRAGGCVLALPVLYLSDFVPGWVHVAAVCLGLLLLMAAPAAALACQRHREMD